MDGVEPLRVVLARLADAAATGCLLVSGTGTARLHLRAGRLAAVALPAGTGPPGTRPAGGRPLGARLLDAGVLTAAALEEAEEVQRSELQGWRLGELLVHLGHLEPAVVGAHVRDQLVDDLHALLSAPCTSTRFRPGERVRGDLVAPLEVRLLLAELGHPVADLPAADLPVAGPPVAGPPVAGPPAADLPAADQRVTEPPVVEPGAPTDAELAATNTRDFADAFASFAAATVGPAVEPDGGPAASAHPDPAAEPPVEVRDRSWDRRDTDTAALLRELSSLGGAGPSPVPDPPPDRLPPDRLPPDRPPAARPAAPTTPAAALAAQRRRKGLFGRS